MTQALAQKLNRVAPKIYRGLYRCAQTKVSRQEVQQIVRQSFSDRGDQDVAMIVFDWLKQRV